MNVYVVTEGKVLTFRQGERFEFSLIGTRKGLVEVKAFAEDDYGKKPEERRYVPAGRVLIGEGDAVLLGTTMPTPRRAPTIQQKGVYVGGGQSWLVLDRISRHERTDDFLRVWGDVILERSEERMVGLFWLKVGTVFGTSDDAYEGPEYSVLPAPIDPPA